MCVYETRTVPSACEGDDDLARASSSRRTEAVGGVWWASRRTVGRSKLPAEYL